MRKVTKEVYITSDGKEFESEAEAMVHEKQIDLVERFGQFCEDNEITSQLKRAEYLKIVAMWEGWIALEEEQEEAA